MIDNTFQELTVLSTVLSFFEESSTSPNCHFPFSFWHVSEAAMAFSYELFKSCT